MQDQQENQGKISGDDGETPHIKENLQGETSTKAPDGMILYQAPLTAEMMHEYPEEPDTVEGALSSYNKKHWEEAMNGELRSLNEIKRGN
ncbi:hypothetical protein JTB14_016389 [Gonioctena quinquepunctata]|nr:hypothetical protein JTB14_016389 [Gonioctena quinquepunctata]